MRYRVIIERDEDGVFVAECPTLPGCVSQGVSRAEAIANIKDAIEGYIASLEKHGEAVPLPISEEIVEVGRRTGCRSAQVPKQSRRFASSGTKSITRRGAT